MIFRRSFTIPVPGLIFSIIGLLYCVFMSVGVGTDVVCLTSGCTLVDDVRIFGISPWWAAALLFGIMTVLSIFRLRALAHYLALIMLLGDLVFMLAMIFLAPCTSCLIAAILIFCAWVALRSRPAMLVTPRRILAGGIGAVWGLLFLLNLGSVLNELPSSKVMQARPDANVSIYFSPSCPACLEAVRIFGDNAEYYPVAEKDGDIGMIADIQERMKAGQSFQSALTEVSGLNSADGYTPPQSGFWGNLALRIALMRNQAVLTERGFQSLPVIMFEGLPRSWTAGQTADKTGADAGQGDAAGQAPEQKPEQAPAQTEQPAGQPEDLSASQPTSQPAEQSPTQSPEPVTDQSTVPATEQVADPANALESGQPVEPAVEPAVEQTAGQTTGLAAEQATEQTAEGGADTAPSAIPNMFEGLSELEKTLGGIIADKAAAQPAGEPGQIEGAAGTAAESAPEATAPDSAAADSAAPGDASGDAAGDATGNATGAATPEAPVTGDLPTAGSAADIPVTGNAEAASPESVSEQTQGGVAAQAMSVESGTPAVPYNPAETSGQPVPADDPASSAPSNEPASSFPVDTSNGAVPAEQPAPADEPGAAATAAAASVSAVADDSGAASSASEPEVSAVPYSGGSGGQTDLSAADLPPDLSTGTLECGPAAAEPCD
ncbi:hypothetical protein LJC48_05250 [Desulfovibrio sp. OttesenSCG-928-C06]|nr:hypothetical protein [Desulfovibrio sp. OttesenSCG-928-C06]